MQCNVCNHVCNVCMHACMHVCVCMYVCTYVRTYVRMYVCMYVCCYMEGLSIMGLRGAPPVHGPHQLKPCKVLLRVLGLVQAS